MRDSLTVPALLDLSHTLAAPLLQKFTFPWEALPEISAFILSLAASLGPDYKQIAPSVWVHKTASVAPTAFLGGPCVIGPETEVRHCAFIRGSALVGAGNCVVGNSVELKNVILFDNVQTPHYNYVGDSILGYRSHMGAGSITSNVKSDKTLVVVKAEPPIETGLKKFGAILGDYVEVGCNSVLNPGCVLGRRVSVYPVSCVRGVIPADSIVKTGGVIVRRQEDWEVS